MKIGVCLIMSGMMTMASGMDSESVGEPWPINGTIKASWTEKPRCFQMEPQQLEVLKLNLQTGSFTIQQGAGNQLAITAIGEQKALENITLTFNNTYGLSIEDKNIPPEKESNDYSSILNLGNIMLNTGTYFGNNFMGDITTGISQTMDNDRVVSSMMQSSITGSNPQKPGILTIQELQSKFGSDMSVGQLLWGRDNGAVQLKGLKLQRGKIVACEILKGSLQNIDGKIYPAGTLFNDGKAFSPKTEETDTGQNEELVVPKSTSLLIELPHTFLKQGLFINVGGDATLNVKELSGVLLQIQTEKTGKLNMNDIRFSNLDLNALGRSEMRMCFMPTTQIITTKISAQQYGRIDLNGQSSCCQSGFNEAKEPLAGTIKVDLSDHSTVNLTTFHTYVSSENAVNFKLSHYSTLALDECNLTKFSLAGTEHSTFSLSEYKNVDYNTDASLFSIINLSNHATAGIKAWFNKIKIYQLNHSKVKIDSNKFFESVIVEGVNHCVTHLNIGVKKAHLTASNHSNINVFQVSENLVDKATNYSSITVQNKPNQKDFKF